MAAPANKTIKDLSGKWVMNKTLSDDIDSILIMQGVGWFLRRAIGLATITLSVSEYTAPVDDDKEKDSDKDALDTPTPTATATAPSTSEPTPSTDSSTTAPATTPADITTADKKTVTHIDIEQTATGGIKGTTERRTLDWTYRTHKDGIFGEVKGKSRWVSLDDLKDSEEWLRTGWLDEDGGMRVQSWVESIENGWTAVQVWGFEEISGTRYHTRHIIVRKGDDWKEARLVYDYYSA